MPVTQRLLFYCMLCVLIASTCNPMPWSTTVKCRLKVASRVHEWFRRVAVELQLERLLFLAAGPAHHRQMHGHGSALGVGGGGAAQRAELSALHRGPAAAVGLVDSSEAAACEARVVVIAFCSALAECAGLRPPSGQSSAPSSPHAHPSEGPDASQSSPASSGPCASRPEEQRAAQDAGQALLARVMAAVQGRANLQQAAYCKGDATHRLKLRAWQALCVLAPFASAEQQPRLLDAVLGAVQRFDLASVKQYQERGVPTDACSLSVHSMQRQQTRSRRQHDDVHVSRISCARANLSFVMPCSTALAHAAPAWRRGADAVPNGQGLQRRQARGCLVCAAGGRPLCHHAPGAAPCLLRPRPGAQQSW
jgi:hypothetical protein